MNIQVITAAPEESFEVFCDRHGLEITVHERAASARKNRSISRWWATFQPHVEIKDGGVLISVAGNGETVDAAIADLSKSILSRTLVTSAWRGRDRREFETPEVWS